METLVRNPALMEQDTGMVEDVTILRKREGQLSIAFTLLLSFNVALVFGAITLAALLAWESIGR